MTSISERYSRATNSSHLGLAEGACDADVLIASGWSGGSVATSLWRMKHTGKPIGFHAAVSHMNSWVRQEARHRHVRDAGAKTKFVVEKTLQWWLHNVCGNCKGRGHPVFDGSPVLEEFNCPACAGSGRIPLSTVVPRAHLDVAEMVLQEVERQSADIFHRMKVRLKG